MGANTFKQFVHFTTDAVGLERTLRLFQAIIHIFSANPFLQELVLLPLLNHSNTSNAKSIITLAAIQPILLALRERLGLVRRFFRMFRFLDSFRSAHQLFTNALVASSASKPGQRRPSWVQTEVWLDAFSRTFNGMYLVVELSTMIEALQIEGLAVWTPAWQRTLHVEAQRFWFFALLCAVFSDLLKMLKVMAYTPVPEVGDVFSEEKTGAAATGEKENCHENDGPFDMAKEQERLRRIVQKRKAGRAAWRRKVRAKTGALGRSVAASALDMVLPGTVVGWIKADACTVGIAMFVTTILTGMGAWERCGQEVVAAELGLNTNLS